MRGQQAFYDIRIFDLLAPCHWELMIEAEHIRNKHEKIRAYDERIQHVVHGTVIPL